LNSAILKWPDKQKVLNEAKLWAESTGLGDRNIIKIFCFGSICTGRWGVGSDLDILIILKQTRVPFISRAMLFNASAISVPTDILVYTESEIATFADEKSRFMDEIQKNSILLYGQNVLKYKGDSGK
jgi:predicted nucleotidyltransferase